MELIITNNKGKKIRKSKEDSLNALYLEYNLEIVLIIIKEKPQV